MTHEKSTHARVLFFRYVELGVKSMNVLHLLAATSLLLSWLIPNHYLPWTAFYNEYAAFMGLFLLLLAEWRSPKRVSWFLLPLLVSIATIIFQLLLNRYHFVSDAWMAIFYLGGALLSYCLGLAVKSREIFVFGLALLILIGTFLNVLIGVFQWFGVTSEWIVTSGRVFGNLAQPNNFATLLGWGIAAASYLYLKCRISSIVYASISVVFAMGIALSESRTPLVQFGFLLVYVTWSMRAGVIVKWRWVLLPIFTFYAFYFLVPYLEGFINFAAPRETRLVGGAYANRFQVWLDAAEAIAASDFLGYGWGQVSIAQFTHLSIDAPRVEFVEHSHNFLLDLLIWNGPLIGGLLMLFLGFWGRRQLLALESVESWFLLLCIGFLVIHACLEYPIEYSYFLIPSFLMLGLIDNNQGRGRPLPVGFCWLPFGIAVFFLCSLTVVWREYRVLEEDHRLMRAQNFGLPVERDLVLSGKLVLLSGEREFLKFARTEVTAPLPRNELEWMKMVAYRYPLAVVIYRYSSALAANGCISEARLELGKIRPLYGEEMYEYYLKYFDDEIINVEKRPAAVPAGMGKISC